MGGRPLRAVGAVLVIAVAFVTPVLATATVTPASADPGPPPTTSVLVPSAGAVLAGAPYLDASASSPLGIASVTFEVSGNGLTDQVVATAAPTLYGYLAKWNTTSVPNGTYSLQSVVTDANNDAPVASAPITITVNNRAPATTVLIPSDGANVSGTKALLDAGASSAVGIASVTYEVSGNGLINQVVATGTPTLYGYLAQWNTTAVPNGTYTLQSVATDSVAESTTSAPVSVTVNNLAPTTTVVLPSNNASVSGYQYVDATASPGVTQVSFEVSGGPANLSDDVIATGSPTLYGWLAVWNTTGVANGTYSLQSVASYGGGVSGTSAPISVTVVPLGLAALDTNIAGTLTSGFNVNVTNSDGNAAGAAGTESLQTNVSLQSGSIVSCSYGPFNECEEGILSGTFTITTSLGTLSGTASGGLLAALISESGPPQTVLSAGGFGLTVTAATGAFASTTGGTLNVSLQFPSGSNDFTGTITG